MADGPRHVLICSCEDTMPLDLGALKRACRGSEVTGAHQLCRAELERFRAAAISGAPLTVGCTQETPLFAEVAWESGADIRYANIRETAGWSKDAKAATPKIAALLAMAAEPSPEIPFVSYESEGVILIYGRDERAIEAADLLKDHLDITVLIRPPAAVMPPRVTEYPVVKGLIRAAKGHLGAFELTVDDFAQPTPSSRAALSFGASKNGAVSRCDIVLDLSGGTPLFAAVRSARRLSARRSRRRSRGAARGHEGARSRRHLRQAALRQLHCRPVRAFALAARRLHPLPRSLPDRRDHARWRPRRDRRACVRGLWAMRGGLPDWRRCLRAAAGRHPDAAAAQLAHNLPRRRRHAAGAAHA